MKIRLLPVLLTFFVTGGLLFGGWFAYQSLAVENPVGDIVGTIDGVEEAVVESGRDGLRVSLELNHNADLYAIYTEILEAGETEAGGRQLDIKIVDNASAELNHVWSIVLFDIAEAMDTHRYGTIPDRLAELAKATPGLTYATAMDNERIYVTLHLNDSSKYIVLPRTAASLGVWPNEQVQ